MSKFGNYYYCELHNQHTCKKIQQRTKNQNISERGCWLVFLHTKTDPCWVLSSNLTPSHLLHSCFGHVDSQKCRSCHFVFEISVAIVDVCAVLVELVAYFQSADISSSPLGSSGRLPLDVGRISTSLPAVLLEYLPMMSDSCGAAMTSDTLRCAVGCPMSRHSLQPNVAPNSDTIFFVM